MFGFLKQFVRRAEFDALTRLVNRNHDFNMETASALKRSDDIRKLDERVKSIENALGAAYRGVPEADAPQPGMHS